MPMLSEIFCEAFQSYGKPRDKIIFNSGLNTVLGGSEGNNSIGKSTFLLIVDYCFGGDTYQKSNVKNFIGDHTICFAFDFDGRKKYFSRTVSEKNIVAICNPEYKPIDKISLKKFREILMEEYFPNYEEGSFRDIVSRFFRIAGKKNDTITNVLNNGSPKMEPAIETLERLFGMYQYVGGLKKQLKESTGKAKALRDAQKYDLVPAAIKNDKQYDRNCQRIRQLLDERDSLTQDTDEDLLQRELERKDAAAELRSRLQAMNRQYRKLTSQYRIVTKNRDEGFVATEEDLRKLGHYFPTANIKKIEEVETFHRELQGILSNDLDEEASSLQILIQAATEEIRKLEAQLSEMGIPIQVPKSFLDKYSDIEAQIAGLRAQNAAYDSKKKFKQETESTGKELDDSERKVLDDIENKLNSQMTRLNDRVYEERREAPSIKFKNGKSYEFFTPRDEGTGTAFKSLILLDFAILELTDLPAVIHDSSIFKNVGDEPIDGIMELYMESEKQVFIAFDKAQAYSQKTREILEATTVLSLNEGGDELFGRSWAKKQSKK